MGKIKEKNKIKQNKNKTQLNTGYKGETGGQLMQARLQEESRHAVASKKIKTEEGDEEEDEKKKEVEKKKIDSFYLSRTRTSRFISRGKPGQSGLAYLHVCMQLLMGMSWMILCD